MNASNNVNNLLYNPVNNDAFIDSLNKRLKSNLSTRLVHTSEYSEKEIEAIERVSSKFFSSDYVLDEDTSSLFRHLTMFSQQSLDLSINITSHRPIIGPIIVRLKKMFWPLIYHMLKKRFETLEEFSSGVVTILALQSSKIHTLQKKIEELETNTVKAAKQ